MPTAAAHSLLLTIVAPSGAGKSSLVDALRRDVPNLQLSISHTTRAPRAGEVDGVNYFFISRDEFIQRQKAGEFVEWAQVHGNFYGTSRQWLDSQMQMQGDILLEIDWQGALQVKRLFPEMVSVFILPPSLEVLHERLKNRAQDSDETITRRLAAATSEIGQAAQFDYVSINDDFDASLAELKSIVQAARCRFLQQKRRHHAMFQSFHLERSE